MAWAVLVLLVSVAPRAHAADPVDTRGDFGVNLAIGGEEARAESIFVTMLSHTRGDSRALNNLGNLRLLRGETGVALAFYERALRGDGDDPGIHLNRATALMILGDKQRSEEAFATGVKLAGGIDRAQQLLGLPPESTPVDRAARKTAIDADQLRAMLKRAASAVPKDSLRLQDSGIETAAATKRTSAWRSAGARAADGNGTPQLLYWKR
jgi:hypothetical protein